MDIPAADYSSDTDDVGFVPDDNGDLSSLQNLTEDSVLRLIQERYRKGEIYTKSGDVLISVNPFKPLSIFGDDDHEMYTPDTLSRTPDLRPHIYWLATLAASRRTRENVDQVVLVSGESGAGKTEATKLMIKHILHLSQSHDHQGLYASIDQVNPLVELFGNARTVLNDNSSRFAKFLELKFSQDGVVTGAVIRDYILEKSRVTSPAEHESNFHIFYTFLDDVMSHPSRQKQFLMERMDKYTDFRILPLQSWHKSNDRMDSRKQANVFQHIGLSHEEVDNLHIILAAILHLTNIRFVDDEGSSGGVVIVDDDPMYKAAHLLSVTPETLTRVLLTTKKKLGKEIIDTPKSQGRAEGGRDAMAKALYERLFGWLIRRINTALNKTSTSAAGIGFLDICGFENLGHNSMEQLCINLANEHLQSFMNKQVFEHEMAIYREECIQLGHVDPPSNEDIIRMFDAPRSGILSLINEDTRLDIATDEGMVMKLTRSCAQFQHYHCYKNDEPRFGINHFAGPVWYDARNFLEKNRDMVGADITHVMVASSNELISDIFQVRRAPTGSISITPFQYRMSQKRNMQFAHPGHVNLSQSVVRGLRQSLKERFGQKIPKMEDPEISKLSNQRTVIDCFQASMKELMDKMKQAQPFFVRCIKPNDEQAPDQFMEQKVRQQLKYNGITEIARIRRVWYPVRIQTDKFLQKYCELVPAAKSEPNKKEAICVILRQMDIGYDMFKVGNKMVFLKEQVSNKLESELHAEKERQRLIREMEERKKKAEEAKPSKPPTDVQGTWLKTIIEVPTPAPTPLPTPSQSLYVSQASLLDCPEIKEVDSEEEEETEKDETKVKEPVAAAAEKTIPAEESVKRFWDIFRIVDREQPATDIQDMRAMKFIKLIAYLFTFCVVLATATMQKVSFMLMVTATNNSKNAEVGVAFYVLLVVAVCLPYALNFLTSLGKVLFGAFRNPSPVTWLWVIFMELLHTFGLSLLVFRVLPRMDAARGLLFLSVAGVLPSVLKPLASVEVKHNGRLDRDRTRCVANSILNSLAFVGQLSVFPIVFTLTYVPFKGNDVLEVLDIIGAVVFVSVSHWENFMDGRLFVTLKDGNWWKQFMLKRRFELDRGRYIPSLVTSVLKILGTVGLAYLFKGDEPMDYLAGLKALHTLGDDIKAISAIITLTLSAVFCYYFSYIACKLWMQKFSFTLPLSLATPCAFVFLYANKENKFLQLVTSNKVFWPDDLKGDWWFLVAGSAWWVALLLLTRHVWFPRQTRLAKFESMFMAPSYCGILTAENLLLNRRRHTLMVKKKHNLSAKGKINYYLSGSEAKDNESDYSSASDLYSTVDEVAAAPGDVEGNIADASPYDRVNAGSDRRKENTDIPMIYACATMWHEVRREMVALLKSLHRLDWEQSMRSEAQKLSGTVDSDFFNYEAHIFFDDAMTLDDNEEVIPNSYVTLMVEVMGEAVSSVHRKTINVAPPIKIPTPYGGQLLWVMPGGNLLFVHVKDKAKIRHRKRWSQVMYMYYLLGFRLTRQCEQQILDVLKSGRVDSRSGWRLNEESEIFEMLDENVARKSQNTFVMALDGDTDFSPGSVHILLDRMKKNPRVGAACGRIHPIGSGPMVWYQMFEYAIGHWMQKATEHVLGCVLCSPGCFSLFRGSALMDDNVMRKYTIMPTEPGHYLQYDQGEDRWLCTLLLQQGYRVDYAAAADAWTYAPEGFNEFFNQRRRWMPSTLANVLDLLSDYNNVVAVNSNISFLYIAYQVALMVATILGPGTVLMMIAGAIQVVFEVDLIWSYVIAVAPALVFLGVCLKCKTNIQLYLAALLSTFYAFVMMVVFVGVIITAATKSPYHPSVLVITVLILIFIVAGIFHPLELFCLPSGILYLLVIPSGYLLLVIYSLANLHVVSWGTRETPKKKTKAEEEEEKREAEENAKKKAQKKGFFAKLFVSSYLTDIKDILQSALGRSAGDKDDKSIQLLQEINENLKKLNADKNGGAAEQGASPANPPDVKITGPDTQSKEKKAHKKKKSVKIVEAAEPAKPVRDDLKNPRWVEEKGLGDGEVMELMQEELVFWKTFIDQYLKPLDADKKKEKEISASLIELRNQVVFAIGMINLLWMAINFMFQLKVPITIKFTIAGNPVTMDILGMLFMIFLIIVLVLQIIGMFIHRWGTLLHLLAFTEVELPCFRRKMTSEQGSIDNYKKVLAFCKKMYEEPIPDYLEDDHGMGRSQNGQSLKDRIRETILGRSVNHQVSFGGNPIAQGFPSSPAMDLFMRATRRQEKEDDVTARDFLGAFRQNIGASQRPVANGVQGEGIANGGVGMYRRRTGRGPPLPPPRQNSTSNHLRRRHGNYFRETVKDIVNRAQREEGISINPARPSFRRYGDRMGAGEGTKGGLESNNVGTMGRALQRRLDIFREFQDGPGRRFVSGVQDV